PHVLFPPRERYAYVLLTSRLCARLRGRVPAHSVEQRRVEPVRELVCVRARSEPGVGPVGGAQEEERRRRHVEVGPELAPLDTFAEELADPLLVPPPLGHEPLLPLALEVAPLADEHRRDVELARDDREVRPQGEADA